MSLIPPKSSMDIQDRNWMDAITKHVLTFIQWVADIAATSWTPTVTAAGAMTITGLTVHVAKYFKIGKLVFYHLTIEFTTGGVASGGVILSFPSTLASGTYVGNSFHLDGGTYQLGMIFNDNATSLTVRKRDSGNWGLGAGRWIWASGFVVIA